MKTWKLAFFGIWRLCLQTSGIYRDSAIHVGGKKQKPERRTACGPAHGLAPLVGARSHPCVALSSAAVSLTLQQP
jgi:hypothetical protein